MSGKPYFERVHSQTRTRFWINNVTREDAELAINAGAVGCTQNPSYTFKMLMDEVEGPYAMQKLDEILKRNENSNEVQETLQRSLVEEIATTFLPLYEASGGKEGFVSIQGNPFKEDTETLVENARFNRKAGANIMAKIPATKEGIEAIGILASEGVPINATEVMAVKQALDVAETYEKATRGMKDRAPIYYSHIAGIYDEYLSNAASEQNIDISKDLLWQAGISIAKKTYSTVKEKYNDVGFIGGGARGVHHFTEMVGVDGAITINWKGTADVLIEQDLPVVQHFLRPTPDSVIDELVEKLEDYRRGYFINAITADEYEAFGPVVHFRKSFEKSWKKAENLITIRRSELGLRN